MHTAKLFVYGTLKQGFYNNYLLKDSKFLKNVVTDDEYPMFMRCENFPYLKNENKGYNIKGELWEVSDEKIKELDYFEGVPDLYYRDTLKVNNEDVFVYFMTEDVNVDDYELFGEFKQSHIF